MPRSSASNGLLAGAAARLLFDTQPPTAYATAQIEDFLRGSGLALMHHRELFDLLDTWLGSLPQATFRAVVPLLRRAFADFLRPGRQAACGPRRGRAGRPRRTELRLDAGPAGAARAARISRRVAGSRGLDYSASGPGAGVARPPARANIALA